MDQRNTVRGLLRHRVQRLFESPPRETSHSELRTDNFVLRTWAGRAQQFACVLMIASGALADTWYVDVGNTSGTEDGTTWDTAFTTIQAGIGAAQDGDTVTVARGTYVENIHFDGKNITLTSTDPEDADVRANTIIDGNQAGPVVTFAGTEDKTCVLTGFTITNGCAVSGGGILGGAITNLTQATISHNTIVGNSSGDGGGLCCCFGAITHNTIAGNTAEDCGGGLAVCFGAILNNTIAGNTAQHNGGGLYGCAWFGAFTNNTIAGNWTQDDGGGLHSCFGGITNCIIWGNEAQTGAQVGPDCDTPAFCCVQDWAGGGEGNVVQNPQFVGGPTGTATDLSYAPDDFTSILSDAGASFSPGVLAGCVVFVGEGQARKAYAIKTNDATTLTVWGDVTQGATVSPPVSYQVMDYHLTGGSSCIDAGNLHYVFGDPLADIDGECRLAGPSVDIGADEYASAPDTDGDLLPDAMEAAQGADPNLSDTDGDGLGDGVEVIRGTSPSVPDVPLGLEVPGDVASIQEALWLAFPGETATVAPGVYEENIRFGGRNLLLQSTDPEDPDVVANTVIDGNQAGSVVTFAGTEDETCLLTGFTITNGKAAYGGGIYGTVLFETLHGTRATITHNTIAGNTALDGGGGLAGCFGAISHNTIAGNTANYGGGLYVCDGAITCNIIAGNTAFDGGGGLYECNGAITHNTIAGNTVQDNGGGLYDCDGPITNCIIWGNEAQTGPQVSVDCDTPAFCCVQDWAGGGEGNVVQDPLFVGGPMGTATDLDYVPDTFTSTLSDAGADFPPGEFADCVVFVGEDEGTRAYAIEANDATTLTVWGDVTQGGTVSAPVAYRVVNYRLSADSPCIDTGCDASAPDLGEVTDDWEGDPRGYDGDGLGRGATGDGSDYDIGPDEFCWVCIRGAIVRADTSAPLPRAVVITIGGGSVRVATVDLNGAYALIGLPEDTYRLTAYAPGMFPGTEEVSALLGPRHIVDFMLAPRVTPPSVRGTITDVGTGQPLGGVRVDAYIGLDLVDTTYTCADGSYEFYDLGSKGAEVRLVFSVNDYQPHEQTVEVEPGQTANGDAVLAPKSVLPGVITGCVRCDGDTVPGALVSASRKEAAIQSAWTDAGGEYVLQGIALRMDYVLQGSAEAHEAQARCVHIDEGTTLACDFDLSIKPGATPAQRPHAADTNGDWAISATEIGRLVTFYNAGGYYVHPDTSDGYAPGEGSRVGPAHASDYSPQDWQISATELSRLVTFYNAGGYHRDGTTQDGYAPDVQGSE